jgi:hypothetical protein
VCGDVAAQLVITSDRRASLELVEHRLFNMEPQSSVTKVKSGLVVGAVFGFWISPRSVPLGARSFAEGLEGFTSTWARSCPGEKQPDQRHVTAFPWHVPAMKAWYVTESVWLQKRGPQPSRYPRALGYSGRECRCSEQVESGLSKG